jgi:hypothetical protein
MSDTEREPDQEPAPTAFERELARQLRESAEGLDAATRSRLNRARQQALAALDGDGARAGWFGAGWQPAAGAAAVAVLAIGAGASWLAQRPGAAPTADASLAATDAAVELELLLAEDNLELIEGLDFYLWVASDPVSGTDPQLPG